ncbi:helix-turn-helix domain-containing protein [Arcobacter sp. CECT 9188]|uniref:helix-turn-helix transcriptional regulator n=1 Tax=Arcobacter sp. CECT 9188 TaxID=2044505 RepID=UPI000DEA5292|nr:helix-turn-helix domain-containing protein [Arcobacter sp. CECT 9188]
MLAPIDFIKEKYIEPNKITQDKLCEVLQIGKKTISELYQKKRAFTIHTAKKFAKFF